MPESLVLKKLLIVGVLLTAGAASAQTDGPATFSIDWYTVDGGGGTSTGGSFSLSGTIGQHDAHPEAAAGGAYSLAGGFWGGLSDIIFTGGFEGP